MSDIGQYLGPRPRRGVPAAPPPPEDSRLSMYLAPAPAAPVAPPPNAAVSTNYPNGLPAPSGPATPGDESRLGLYLRGGQPAAAPAAGPAAPGPTPGTPAPQDGRGAELTAGQQSVWDTIRATLHQYGLDTPEVLDWAHQQVVDNASDSSITLDLYDPTTVPGKIVNQLYPELALRRADPTKQSWSIATAQQYRSTLNQIASQASLTPGFLDSDTITKLAVGDVAPTEVKDRISLAAQYAGLAPAETRSQFDAIYGTGLGDHAAYWLDPTRTETLLQKQLAAAQLSGTGVRSGFGGLSQAEAERYASLGLSDQQASAGFGQLVQNEGLFGQLPGEASPGINRAAQLAAGLGGDAGAQLAIERQRRARLAVFGGGGGLGATQTGIGGLGSAATA